jgi:predicted PurR-regulated permease PerM
MLLFLIALLGYLAYQIISPFLAAIGWAVVLSIVFYPVYAYICRYVRFRSVASVATILMMLVVLIGPIAYLASILVIETQNFILSIDREWFESVKSYYERIRSSQYFARIGPVIGELPPQEVLAEALRNNAKIIVENISGQLTNLFSILVNFLFMIFTAFFLLRDGPGFLTAAKDFMPFHEKQKEHISTQVKDMIVSTVYGGATVAVIQGLLGGLAFAVIGISSPVMWGVAMALMSFVPMIGTFAIWGPASVYLVLNGSLLKGIGLVLYGTLVISMVDNILRPVIIGSRTKMPTILILFSVLGGIKLFGMIGFVMGPLIMAVFISVFEIFRHIEDEETDKGS